MNKMYQPSIPGVKNAPKRGFTLIELLVVVLIIGILAAVALPKYQIAVEKARSAGAISALKALKDAQERYYMANGRYSNAMGNLDVTIPEVDGFFWELSTLSQGRWVLSRLDGDYVLAASGQFRKADITNIFYCCPSNNRGIRICKAIGAEKMINNATCAHAYEIK